MIRSTLLSLSLCMLLPLTACGQIADGPPASSGSDNQTETPLETAGTKTTRTPAVIAQDTETSDMEAAEKPEGDEKNATHWGQNVDADGFEELAWEDLMPEGEEDRLREMYAMQMQSLYAGGGIAEGSAADTATQIGTFNVVKELDGVKIKLPGYTVPFDFSPNAQIHEFLLVPYFGACLHAPPPPPNQTVYVKTDEAIKIGDLAQAVWIYGTLKTTTQSTDTADTAYTVILDKIEEYSY
jgi:hypothetical protein